MSNNSKYAITFICILVAVFACVDFIHRNPKSAQPKISPVDINTQVFTKEYQDFVATEASKKTVDFIVNKMIEEKQIIVNKNGLSYLFTLKELTPQKK